MKIALRFALVYILVAGAYIILSDWIVLRGANDASALTRLQHIKGLTFVGMSGLLIFAFIYHYVRSRDRVQNELEEARSSFEQLFQRIPVPTVVYDTRTLRFLAVNQATATEYGYALEDFPRMKVTDMVPERDVPEATRHIARVARSYTGHWEHRRRDGSTFEVEIISHPMLFAGEPARLVTARNITTRKLIEKVLAEAHASRLEAAEIKSRFLSTISHEMRTPLNAITGCLDFLAAETEPQQRREFVETAHQSAADLLRLIERMIQASSLADSPAPLQPQEIEVRAFLRRIVDNFAPVAVRKNIQLTLDIASSLPDKARVHASWLEETLQILLENSVKFSHGGRVAISARPAADGLQLAISDEGIGIAETEQLKIFDPFYQADQSSSRKYGGLGLGLFVARQLCDLMGAQLAVRSTPEVGSTFVVSLRSA